MPRIQRLEPSKHVEGRYLVFLEGGELIKVTAEEVLTFALAPGKELDPETRQALSRAGALSSAKARAAAMIGARALSRGELVQRLVEKGEDPLCAQQAADWLAGIGALDDGAYAAMVVRHYSAKGWGRRRIQDELFRRRVPRDYWEDALAQLPESDGVLDSLIEKKLRGRVPDQSELRRLSGFLARRGFGWEEIRDALSRYGASEEEP